MKFSSLVWGLFLGAVTRIAAEDVEDDDVIPEDYSLETTEFDGKKVPPILELTPDNFDKEIKGSKYILVKHYRCAPTLVNTPTSMLVLTLRQSVLPTLSGLCADVPHVIRVLHYRGNTRPLKIILRVLRLAICND